ncbi:unnamed protein product, partial [Mesorhabditis belari]|uniref:Dystrophin n=1 Tax=Mesorhabditis belari TaxID=2138241 RepID=A0AAF3F0I4_9BILA
MLFSGSAAAAPVKKKDEKRRERNERDEKHELQENVFVRWVGIILGDEAPREPRELADPNIVAKAISRITGNAAISAPSRYEFFQTIINELGVFGTKLTPSELTEHSQKAVLQMWWCILHLYWQRMAPEPLKREKVQDAMRMWCMDVCKAYPEVNVNDFTSSWRDGHAFNILLHNFDPKLVKMSEISEMSGLERIENAFTVAERLGVPRLMNSRDLHSEFLDSRSVVVYLVSLYLTLQGKSEEQRQIQGQRVTGPAFGQPLPDPHSLPLTNPEPLSLQGQIIEEQPSHSLAMSQPSSAGQQDEPTVEKTFHLPILPEPFVSQTVALSTDLRREKQPKQQSIDNPTNEVESIRSRKSSSSSQKSSKGKKMKKDELAKEFDSCLEQVLAWLLEAEEECAVLSDVETNDVTAVKTQFRDYEQFMASLTESQDTVGRVLHRGQLLCQKSETEAEREAIQQQLELVNSRWERLRALAMDRQTVLQSALTTLQQKQLNEICGWMADTETLITAAGALAETQDAALKQIEDHARLQKRIADFEPTVAQLSSFVAVVDEGETESDMSVAQLETTLRTVGQRWEGICLWAETRAQHLDGLAELFDTADEVFSRLNAWLKEREHELLGLKSAHHLDEREQVAEQVRLLQQAEASLEAEHSSFVRASQLSCELVARLDTGNGAAANEVRRRLDTLTQRWDNLVTRIEEHSNTLVKSGKAGLKKPDLSIETPIETPIQAESEEKKRIEETDTENVKYPEEETLNQDIVDRFLAHVERVSTEMRPLSDWCHAFTLSKRPTEARKMIALCQGKLVEIKEQEAKVNHLQLEMERIHMNKDLSAGQLKAANDAFAHFAKDWAEIVTKISEALNVLSGHSDGDEEGVVARGIEQWMEGCERVLNEMQKASISERALRAKKLKEQWDTQNSNLNFIQKDHLKRAILTKGLQLIGKRLQQHIAFEAPVTPTSSVMMTSSVQSAPGAEPRLKELETSLSGPWHSVGDLRHLRDDFAKIEKLTQTLKGEKLPIDFVEMAEKRRAETLERLEITQKAAEMIEKAQIGLDRISSKVESASNSTDDFPAVIARLNGLREELAAEETLRKDAERLAEKMLLRDPDLDQDITAAWRARVNKLAEDWSKLADSIEDTISCVKKEHRMSVQKAINDGDRVLKDLEKTLVESESAADAEQLSEHLDQIESLLEQVPDTSGLEPVVEAINENFVRDSWQRHSASREKIQGKAKERIQQINDRVHQCERFDQIAGELEKWAPRFSALLAARKGADISALDVPEEYKHSFESGTLITAMQNEFDEQTKAIGEMREIAGKEQNERLDEQMKHAEKTFADLAPRFATFKQPVHFEGKLEKCTEKLTQIEHSLDELTGLKLESIESGLLEAKNSVKDLISLDETLKDLDTGRERLLRDSILNKNEATEVKAKLQIAKRKTKELGLRAEEAVDRLDDCKILAEKLKDEMGKVDKMLSLMENRLEEYGRQESNLEEDKIEEMVNEWNRNEAIVRSLEELERVLKSKAIDIETRTGSGERRRRAQELKTRLDAWNLTAREMNDDHESLLLEVDELHEDLMKKLDDAEKEDDPKEIASRLHFLRHDRDRLSSRARRLAMLNPRLAQSDPVADVNSRWHRLEERMETESGDIHQPPPLPPPHPPHQSFEDGVKRLAESFDVAVKYLDFDEYPVRNANEWRDRVKASEEWMSARREALSEVVGDGRRLADTGRMELDTHRAIEELDNVIDTANEFESEIERNRGDVDIAIEKSEALQRDLRLMKDVIESLSKRNLQEPEIVQATRKDLSSRDPQLCSLSRRAAELHASLPGRSSASRDTTLDALNQGLSSLESILAGSDRRERSGRDEAKEELEELETSLKNENELQTSPDRTSRSSVGNSLAMEVMCTDQGTTTEDETLSRGEQGDAEIKVDADRRTESIDVPIEFVDAARIKPITLGVELDVAEQKSFDWILKFDEGEMIFERGESLEEWAKSTTPVDQQSGLHGGNVAQVSAETPAGPRERKVESSGNLSLENRNESVGLREVERVNRGEAVVQSGVRKANEFNQDQPQAKARDRGQAAELNREASEVGELNRETLEESIQVTVPPGDTSMIPKESFEGDDGSLSVIHYEDNLFPISEPENENVLGTVVKPLPPLEGSASFATRELRKRDGGGAIKPEPKRSRAESATKHSKIASMSMEEVYELLDNIEDGLSFEEEYPLENVDHDDKEYKEMHKQLDEAARALDVNQMELNMMQAEHTKERIDSLRKDVEERKRKSHDERKEWHDFSKCLVEAERLFQKGVRLSGEFERKYESGDRDSTKAKELLERILRTMNRSEVAVCEVVRRVAGVLPRMREGGKRETDTRTTVYSLDQRFAEWSRKARVLLDKSAVDVEALKYQLNGIKNWCDLVETELGEPVHWAHLEMVEEQKEKLSKRLSEMAVHRASMSHVESCKDRLVLLPTVDQEIKHEMRRAVSDAARRLADIRSDLSDRVRGLDEMKVKAEEVWREVETLEQMAKEIERRVEATKEAVIYTPSRESTASVKNDAADLRQAVNKLEKILENAEKDRPNMLEKHKKKISAVISISRNAASAADSLVLRESSSAQESSEMSLSTVIEVSERSERSELTAQHRPGSSISAEGTLDAPSDRVESLHDEVHTSDEDESTERSHRQRISATGSPSAAGPPLPDHGLLPPRDQHAMQTLTQLGLWLGEVERDAGMAVDLASHQKIKEQINILQTLQEQLRQRQMEPINVSDGTMTSVVKQRAADLCTSIERVSAASQKRRAHLGKAVETAKWLEQTRGGVELWMAGAEEDFGTRAPMESNEETVRVELGRVESILEQLPQQKQKIHEINIKGNALLDEFPRDEAHNLSHLLSRLNMRWTQFNDNIRIRRAALEASLRSRADFHSALAEVEEWMHRITASLQKLEKRTSNTQSLKDTQRRREWIQAEKNLGHEIDAHSEVIRSVEEMGKKIVAGFDTGKDQQTMEDRLNDLETRWTGITQTQAEIRKRLADAEQEWERLTNGLAELVHWIETKSKQLLNQQPIGGSLSAVLAQGGFVKNIEREIEAKSPQVKEVIASAHSYLMQHDLRPKMYKPGVLDDGEEEAETKDMDERRYGLQIHADCEKLKEKWSELSDQTSDWGKVVAGAAQRLQELERALAECQLHLSSVEQELEQARAVENLRLEELKNARVDVDAMSDRVDQLRVHLDDANDACGRILAADMPLDTHPKNQLDAVNQRFTAVKTSVRVRAAALRNAFNDFGPSSEHFLNHSVTLPWQRAISKTNHLPYYIDHNTEHTQWEHPVWVEMAKELNSFNRVKFIAYRCAMKLRALQKRLCLDLISLPMLEKAFARLDGLSNEECPQLDEMVSSLLPLFESLHQLHPTLVKSVALAVDLCINFLLNLYDSSRDGILRVLSFKVALIVFCNAPLEEKYRALFELVAQEGQADQKHVALLFYDLIHIPRLVGEAAAFGGSNVEPSVRSCFESVKLASHIQFTPFMDWLKKEPQSLVWLPVMHRLATAEFSKHQAKCNVCKMFPIVGLRYRCLHCFNFDICQNCFFSQRTSKNHKLRHPMQEYSIPTTSGEDVRDFAQMLRNKLGRRRKTIGYLPVDVGDEGRPLAMTAPAAHNPHTVAVHSRVASCAQRIAHLTQNEAAEPREEMIKSVSDVKSPLQLISQVDQMQKDELDQMLQRLQLENVELKRELERKRHAAQSTPDLDRTGYGGTMPRHRENAARGGTLPRLGAHGGAGGGGGHGHGRSVPSLHTAKSTNDVGTGEEARALRMHKQRLEHRSRILEQQNQQLEMQLQRLKKMIEQQRESTSRLPSMSAERDWQQTGGHGPILNGDKGEYQAPMHTNGNGLHHPAVSSQDWESDMEQTDVQGLGRGPDRMHSLLATVDDLGRAMESLVVSVVCDSDHEQ